MSQQGHSRLLPTDLQQEGVLETQVCMHAHTLHPTCLRDLDIWKLSCPQDIALLNVA